MNVQKSSFSGMMFRVGRVVWIKKIIGGWVFNQNFTTRSVILEMRDRLEIGW